jgi:hypothetical protein
MITKGSGTHQEDIKNCLPNSTVSDTQNKNGQKSKGVIYNSVMVGPQ